MPFASHVSGISSFFQLVCNGRAVQGQSVRLRVGNNPMLEACVNLWRVKLNIVERVRPEICRDLSGMGSSPDTGALA
ncbi:hypothetical protein PoB_000929000 [Plakobranchus ocellatus]|uniref:Uncharacterized protein n=1 Tax=Plakobranchus ocellatus TaxID=259542 RepID=A0AAV3YJ76_9GAST|nr:hypothetical protein PoB_000929000 [Plakobranchus ocellatus]